MNNRLSLIVLLALVAAGTACSELLFDDREQVYEGQPVIEFAPILPAGTYVHNVTFEPDSEETETVSVRINYVAPAPSRDVAGEFAVADASTAVEGQHFALPEGMAYRIAAGTNSTAAPIVIDASGLANGESVTLILRLADGDDFAVSANYDSFEIRVNKRASG